MRYPMRLAQGRRAPADRARETALSERGRIAGIDFGTKRIGIATADLETRIAFPHEVYARQNPAADAEYFRRLVREERLCRFVVGLPIHLNGRESQKSFQARQFGDWLGQATGLGVEFFDERFTSAEAESMLLEAELTKRQRQARIDKLAAQIMLAAYLESGGHSEPPAALDD